MRGSKKNNSSEELPSIRGAVCRVDRAWPCSLTGLSHKWQFSIRKVLTTYRQGCVLTFKLDVLDMPVTEESSPEYTDEAFGSIERGDEVASSGNAEADATQPSPIGVKLSRSQLMRGAFGVAASCLAVPMLGGRVRAATATLPYGLPGYQRLFPGLAAAVHEPEDLRRLAMGDGASLIGMTAPPEVMRNAEGQPRRNAQGHLLITATPEDSQDDEENFGVPSGYAYLGQFVDHDLTHNATSALSPHNANGAPNLRSARFDLDSLYGRGPSDQPYLYEADGRRLRSGRSLSRNGAPSPARDHPRIDGQAIIGDKRNDENVIVSQLHGVFRDFHNRVAADHPTKDFEALQRIVSHHYQWILLTDFLPRICGTQTMEAILPGFAPNQSCCNFRTNRITTKALRAGELPLEFAAAAYRMGHSMIRPAYRLNTRMTGTPEERRINPAIAGRRLIFAAAIQGGLNGMRAFPAEWGIDWSLYFEINRPLELKRLKDGIHRVQAAYKFDTSLVNPLAFLPEFSETSSDGGLRRDRNGQPAPQSGAISNLALRNLLRGAQQGLASGQAVARAMGIDVLNDRDLRVGKATVEGIEQNHPITEYGDSFKENAPLWFYILAEAQHFWTERSHAFEGNASVKDALPSTLGPLGARIVGETFVALMELDQNSLLHADRGWRPQYARNGRFTMAELVLAAQLA